MNLIVLGEEYKLWSSSSRSFLQPPVISSLLGPNIILSTLILNTLSLCSYLAVWDQVPQPNRTKGKIILLHRPPLWSSGQSSWLQIQRSGFDSRYYQIFWEVVGPQRGTLILVSTTQKLLGRKSRGSRSRNSRIQPYYMQTLALTSLTSGGRSVGIVRSLTQATEFTLLHNIILKLLDSRRENVAANSKLNHHQNLRITLCNKKDNLFVWNAF
jgi:hypothetical protein